MNKTANWPESNKILIHKEKKKKKQKKQSVERWDTMWASVFGVCRVRIKAHTHLISITHHIYLASSSV